MVDGRQSTFIVGMVWWESRQFLKNSYVVDTTLCLAACV